jgi:hypothetical protein
LGGLLGFGGVCGPRFVAVGMLGWGRGVVFGGIYIRSEYQKFQQFVGAWSLNYQFEPLVQVRENQTRKDIKPHRLFI